MLQNTVDAIIFDLTQMPMKTRLAILDDHAHQLETKGRSYWMELPHQRKGFHLMGVANDAKTIKGEKLDVDTGIIYMIADSQATPKGTTLCEWAIEALCNKACLLTAGRGRMTSVEMSRLYKTLYYLQMREDFLARLRKELAAHQIRAEKAGRQAAFRFDGTTDTGEGYALAQEFPAIEFYDYSKGVSRSIERNNTLPNYHVTLSYSGAKPDYAARVLDAVRNGENASVVFRTRAMLEKAMLEGWNGFQVLDGDEHDVRYLDKRGSYIIGLGAKGKAKTDRKGFVVDI